jgi:hypothetical protein
MLCCMCHQVTSGDMSVVVVRQSEKKAAVVMCKRCHNLHNRIERLQSSHGALIVDWRNLSHEEKDALIAENQELAGPLWWQSSRSAFPCGRAPPARSRLRASATT